MNNQIVWTNISSSSNSSAGYHGVGYYDQDAYFTPYQPNWYSTTTTSPKKEIPDGPLDWLDRRVREITDLVAA